MGRYVLRRLLEIIPVFFGTTLLIYWLVWAMPGDPFAGKCGDRRCPQTYIDTMTEKYRLDDPLPIQYAHYMAGLLRGDFGETFGGRKVSDILVAAYPATLKLALVALVLEAVIGIAAGVLSGLRRNGFLDNLVLLSTMFMLGIPMFVSGFVLQFLLGVKWGLVSPTVDPGAPWHQLLIPGWVLASLSLAAIARLTRGSIAENGRSDFVRAAMAKGLPRRRVVGVHMLRNSVIPVITFLSLDLGGLLGGTVILEGIFGINGIGNELYRGVVTKEGATVAGLVVVFMLGYLLLNLVVDVLYAVLDPRIRLE
jgi:oligopeptide transport system permease protein